LLRVPVWVSLHAVASGHEDAEADGGDADEDPGPALIRVEELLGRVLEGILGELAGACAHAVGRRGAVPMLDVAVDTLTHTVLLLGA